MPAFDDTQFEMISAYLDGELSVEDCAVVEQLLDASDEYRKLYDELKSLHEDLAALPSMQPSANLTHRIMESVEQAAAAAPSSSSAAPDTIASDSAAPKTTATDLVSPARQGGASSAARWRRIALQTVVAATALFVALYGVYRMTRPIEKGNDPHFAGGGPSTPDRVDPNGVPDIGPDIGPDKRPLAPPNAIPDVPGMSPEDLLGGGFVFNEVKADLLFVMEYAVDPELLAEGVFKKTLRMHGIEVNDAIVPDAATRKAIESSRAFGGENRPGDANVGLGNIEFSIVVADVDKLFLISETLRTMDGVQGMKVDLSLHNSDLEMMRMLSRDRDDQFADAKPGPGGRAYFVSLHDDLRTVLLGSTVALSKLESNKGEAPKDLGLGGGKETMPVAFILRSAAPKK